MKVRGVDFIFYNVGNMKKALKFYKDTLGLKLLGKAGDTWAEFETGNMALAIGKYGKVKTSLTAVALAVDDVKKSLVYLKKKKIKVIQDLYDSAGCQMAIIADPDGNQIILHHRKDGTVG